MIQYPKFIDEFVLGSQPIIDTLSFDTVGCEIQIPVFSAKDLISIYPLQQAYFSWKTQSLFFPLTLQY